MKTKTARSVSDSTRSEGQERQINWFELASRAMVARYPETQGCSDYLTERLSALLVERLPDDLAEQLISILPASIGAHSWPLHAVNRHGSDRSIGLADFVERARNAIGCTDLRLPDHAMEELAGRVTEVFLWSFSDELPTELKHRLADVLPMDLRARMNLYQATAPSSRVA